MASKAKSKSKRVARKPTSGIRRWYQETIGELRKVSWPTKKEAYSLTKVVIAVMLFFMAFLGGLDALFVQFFSWLFGAH